MSDAGCYDGRYELYDAVGRLIWYIASAVFMGLTGLISYAYFNKKGQFKEMEDVKYQIFHEDEGR